MRAKDIKPNTVYLVGNYNEPYLSDAEPIQERQVYVLGTGTRYGHHTTRRRFVGQAIGSSYKLYGCRDFELSQVHTEVGTIDDLRRRDAEEKARQKKAQADREAANDRASRLVVKLQEYAPSARSADHYVTGVVRRITISVDDVEKLLELLRTREER